MNYYIDFDNTLYNTSLLTKRIIETIVEGITKQKELNKDELFNECKENFNNQAIFNINQLIINLSNKYMVESSKIIQNVNEIILNSEDLVFEDVIPFLKKLKEKGHNLYLLTYCKNGLQYQTTKIIGSKLANYFDALYITCKLKYELDIDYTNGIFIDDNPSDLLGLYSKNPKDIIRLRRKENKYSIKDIENYNIKEYSDLTKMLIL